MSFERILFMLLIVSPAIGLIMLAIKGFSDSYNPNGNDAGYYSLWTLVTVVGLFFDVPSLASSSLGDYGSGLLYSWNLLLDINWFPYFGFIFGCGWGFITMKTDREAESIMEVGKFLVKVIVATVGAFVLLVLFNTIAPIASRIN